jgi:hypothetical protein
MTMLQNINPLYIFVALLAATGALYSHKHVALSYACAMFAILYYLTSVKEGFTSSSSIQDNGVGGGKKGPPNMLKEYVPYKLSPFLDLPYRSGKVGGLDAKASAHEPVNGKMYPTPFQANMFANNLAKPEYCEQGNAMFSTDMGCVKLTPEQLRFFGSRGYNTDPTRSYM